jgi:hypothetical protein
MIAIKSHIQLSEHDTFTLSKEDSVNMKFELVNVTK